MKNITILSFVTWLLLGCTSLEMTLGEYTHHSIPRFHPIPYGKKENISQFLEKHQKYRKNVKILSKTVYKELSKYRKECEKHYNKADPHIKKYLHVLENLTEKEIENQLHVLFLHTGAMSYLPIYQLTLKKFITTPLRKIEYHPLPNAIEGQFLIDWNYNFSTFSWERSGTIRLCPFKVQAIKNYKKRFEGILLHEITHLFTNNRNKWVFKPLFIESSIEEEAFIEAIQHGSENYEVIVYVPNSLLAYLLLHTMPKESLYFWNKWLNANQLFVRAKKVLDCSDEEVRYLRSILEYKGKKDDKFLIADIENFIDFIHSRDLAKQMPASKKAHFWYQCSIVLNKIGKHEKSQKYLKKAWKIDPKPEYNNGDFFNNGFEIFLLDKRW